MPIQIVSDNSTDEARVKPASTAAVATDPALVVAISPNNNVPISGTVMANIGTSGSLALDATLTGGTQTSRVTDGTNTASVKAASTAAGATDKALVVAVSPNNSVAVTGTFFQGTQPVSGTVVANAGSGSFTVAQATAANLNATVSGSVSVSNFPATQPVSGTFFQATQPISGTVSSTQGTATAAAGAWPIKITDGTNTAAVDSDLALNITIQGSTSGTATNVAANAANVTLLSSNAARDMASFYNDGNGNAFLKLGATASTSSFTVKITPGGFYELPLPAYAGQIDCIWDVANGSMRITEQV